MEAFRIGGWESSMYKSPEQWKWFPAECVFHMDKPHKIRPDSSVQKVNKII